MTADETDHQSKRLAVFLRAQRIGAGELQCAAADCIRAEIGLKILDTSRHDDTMMRVARIFAFGNL